MFTKHQNGICRVEYMYICIYNEDKCLQNHLLKPTKVTYQAEDFLKVSFIMLQEDEKGHPWDTWGRVGYMWDTWGKVRTHGIRLGHPYDTWGKVKTHVGHMGEG